RRGGFGATALGFLGGACAFTAANGWLSRAGARRRKRSAGQPSEGEDSGSGLAIAVGSLLDGVPESVVIGLSLLGGGAVGWVAVTAVFLSNVPEGLSSSVGMKRAGRSPGYVFGVWCGIALLCGLSSLAGYAVFAGLGLEVIAATTAVAAGAILAML